MNSRNLLEIKKKIKGLIEDKDVLDVILFGSIVKGKVDPNDIDIAIISEKEKSKFIPGFHIISIKPKDFFVNPPTLVTSLLREGYSLKNDKTLAENLRFEPKVLYTYVLKSLSASNKVRIARILHGAENNKGMVAEHSGSWISNQVFMISPTQDYLFEQFFIQNEIPFTRKYMLVQ